MHILASFSAAVLSEIGRGALTDAEMRCLTLTPCDKEKISSLWSAARRQSKAYAEDLAALCALSYEAMKQSRHDPSHSRAWRRLYTDATLVWSLLDILDGDQSGKSKTSKYWEDAIERLDNAIVIAGAPGEGRLHLILDIIQQIQKTCLPPKSSPLDNEIPPIPQQSSLEKQEVLWSASLPVPVLCDAPSLSAFRLTFSRSPFILRRFAVDWSAVKERKWASKAYLHAKTGRGRVVPVEVGRDYRTADWTQRMMQWDEFLDYWFSGDSDRVAKSKGKMHNDVLYLAQHDIFKQFPALRDDIVVPDYVYATPPPPDHYPQYRPPANDEELVLNTWIGPEGTISPAHTDPFFNIYTQVVGRKTVWIAPPNVSHILSPCPEQAGLGTQISSSETPKPNSDLHMDSGGDSALSNTTRFDVFASASDIQQEREFLETVRSVAMSAILDEGDMLFFPPGWWHAFRGESTSFSVSMWF